MTAPAIDLRPTFFTPQVAPAEERPQVEELSERLEEYLEPRQAKAQPRLRLEIGKEQLVVPAFLAAMLRDLVAALARGDMVTLIPSHRELTSQEAADILNVSRQYVVQLLDEGAIPFTRVNKHRRIRADDLIAFKQQRDDRRRAGLRQMTQDAQEMGNYFGKK
ncbi:MAG: helix-turn-helix domain-containing protein [Myxococcaceae bacterium]